MTGPRRPAPGASLRFSVTTGAALRVFLLAALAVSGLGPFAVLLLRSVATGWSGPGLVPEGLTASGWEAALGAGTPLARAALTSLALGASTGALSCALAVPFGRALARLPGWRRYAGAAAAFLPVAAPPIALAVGLQYAFLRAGLGGTFAGVLLAHLVPAAGYASLFLLGVFALFDFGVEEEARSLGAAPWQVQARVTLPILRRPLLEAFALGFLVSWSHVPLTLVVGQGAVRTLPLQVFAYLQAGQDRLGAAGALMLVLPAVLALLAIAAGIRRTAAVGA